MPPQLRQRYRALLQLLQATNANAERPQRCKSELYAVAARNCRVRLVSLHALANFSLDFSAGSRRLLRRRGRGEPKESADSPPLHIAARGTRRRSTATRGSAAPAQDDGAAARARAGRAPRLAVPRILLERPHLRDRVVQHLMEGSDPGRGPVDKRRGRRRGVRLQDHVDPAPFSRTHRQGRLE